MQYFRSGNRVARVHTDSSYGEEFIAAPGDVYSVKRGDWAPRPSITSKIMYSGDWQACTETEARDLITERLRRIRLRSADSIAGLDAKGMSGCGWAR